MIAYTSKHYRSDLIISWEYKQEILAKMLAGYDEATWDKLRADRKRTYLRAASQVLTAWPDFVAKMVEFAEVQE